MAQRMIPINRHRYGNRRIQWPYVLGRLFVTGQALALNAACLLAGRAGLLGGAHPFGIALFYTIVCTGYRARSIVAALFILLGLSTSASLYRVLATGLALVVMLVYKAGGRQRHQRSTGLDILVLAALLAGARLLVIQCTFGLTQRALVGIGLEAVMVILVSVLLAPLADLLRGGLPSRLSNEQLVSAGLAAVVIGLGLQGWHIGYIQPAEVWNRWVILFTAFLGSGAIGAAQGTALGLMAEISATAPLGGGAGLYGISGLLGGLFSQRGKVAVIGGFVLGNLIASVRAVSGEEIVVGFLQTALAAILFMITPRYLVRQVERAIPGSDAAIQLAAGREKRLRLLISQRLEQMAQVFGELSSIFQCVTPQRASVNQDILPRQLEGVAEVIRSFAGQVPLDTSLADEIEARVADELRHRRINYSELNVLNADGSHPEISLQLVDGCAGDGQCARLTAQAVTTALLESYVPWQMQCHGSLGNCQVKLAPERPLDVIIRAATLAKGDSDVSGDTCAQAELAEGKVAVLLSDGMGSGRPAHMESSATVTMLQRLLKAGFDHRFAVQTVNSILLHRSPAETYATLDLAIIDMFTGELEFLKTGSVPSFIRRGPEVEILRTASLPIGILNHIDVPVRYRQLRTDDILVMVTDGVLDAIPEHGRTEEWFARLLRRQDTNDPASLADSLLSNLSQLSDTIKDDMTVVVVKVIARDGHINQYARSGAGMLGKDDLPIFRRQVPAANRIR